MLDKMAISVRFFSCYHGMRKSDVARLYGVCRNTVTEWDTKGTIPWSKLKYLSDSQAVSWDWLLAGIEPKTSPKEAKTPRSTTPRFPKPSINRRYLSLYDGMKQIHIADMLDVTSTTITDWKNCKRQVPWRRLEDAVNTFGIRWDWLIDGLDPKYQNGDA